MLGGFGPKECIMSVYQFSLTEEILPNNLSPTNTKKKKDLTEAAKGYNHKGFVCQIN